MTAIESMYLKVSNTGSRIASCFNDADSAPKLVECAPPASTTIVTGSGAHIIKREHTGANVAASNSASGFTATHTVLVASNEPLRREFLSSVIRRRVGCRVLEAPGMTESRYLAAVEGSIHVIVLSFRSADEEQMELARWFRTTHPESRVVVAGGSLWELNGQSSALEQVLMAKSYTPAELASTIRCILGEAGPVTVSEPVARPSEIAPAAPRTMPTD